MKNGQWRNGILGLLVLWTAILLWPAAAGAQDDLMQLKAELEAQRQKQADLQDRINQLEARQRLKERAMSEKIEQVEAKAEKAEAKEPCGGLPDSLKWLEKIKISGDFRYRHEHIDSQRVVDNRSEWRTGRDRERIRARLMINAIVNDEWDVAFRMATGQYDVVGDTVLADAVSTNQTLTDFGSRKDFWLDLAYFDYHPLAIEGLNVIGGKMPTPFYKVGKNQLMWDSDLTPEGGALQYVRALSESDTLAVNGGGFWLNEESSDVDTLLWGIQTYIKHPFSKPNYILAGAGWYDYGNVQGLEDEYGIGLGNTIDPVTDEWVNDYDIIEFLAEYGTEVGQLPLVAYGTWVKNTAAAGADTGWLVGAMIGKARNPGSWQFGYNYRDVERDAVLSVWNDSDFNGGLTGGKGHTLSAAYQAFKNVQLALTYFHGEVELTSPDLDYRRLHAEVVVKF